LGGEWQNVAVHRDTGADVESLAVNLGGSRNLGYIENQVLESLYADPLTL
jgi:hypothetical protein